MEAKTRPRYGSLRAAVATEDNPTPNPNPVAMAVEHDISEYAPAFQEEEHRLQVHTLHIG